MKAWKGFLLALLLVVAVGAIFGVVFVRRGFRATAEPSQFETVVSRTVRNLAIPRRARNEKNPLTVNSENLEEGRENFLVRCANCHGHDGSGVTPVGRNLYPRVPDLRAEQTQNLTDGEIHYIIENGVELTGMPAWGNPHQAQNDDSGDARLGQSTSSAKRRQLEARHFHPKPSPAHQPRAGSAIAGRHVRALRRLAGMSEVSRANLRALAKDAHGQCGS